MKRYLAPLVIGLAGISVLVSLGNWQVRRLAWKEGILAGINTMLATEARPLDAVIADGAPRFAPVILQGVAGTRELHVLVSHKKLGAGYRVVTAFGQLGGGIVVLLDQGFIPSEAKGEARTPLEGRVSGNLHIPDDRNSSTPENDVADNTWFARDIDQMAAELGTAPYLVVLREAEDLDPGITPLPVDASAIPNDHLQYAITWYALALVWLGMTAYWLWLIRRRMD